MDWGHFGVLKLTLEVLLRNPCFHLYLTPLRSFCFYLAFSVKLLSMSSAKGKQAVLFWFRNMAVWGAPSDVQIISIGNSGFSAAETPFRLLIRVE